MTKKPHNESNFSNSQRKQQQVQVAEAVIGLIALNTMINQIKSEQEFAKLDQEIARSKQALKEFNRDCEERIHRLRVENALDRIANQYPSLPAYYIY